MIVQSAGSAGRILLLRAVLVAIGCTGIAASVGAATRGDMNGDGRADLLWRHASTGANSVWLMNGTVVASELTLPPEPDRGWRIQASDDFTGDGSADVLWHHVDSGESRIWVVRGGAVTRRHDLPALPDTDWRIVATGDLDGDGQSDIVWRHHATGRNRLWLIRRGSVMSQLTLPDEIDLEWAVVGAGDFNGDGRTDLFWRHATYGTTAVWLMNGASRLVSNNVGTLTDPGWVLGGVGDLDGDRKADILWRHANTGQNQVWRMDGARMARTGSGNLALLADPEWHVLTLADVNADTRADVVWRHVGTGNVTVWLQNGLVTTGNGLARGATDLAWSLAGDSANAGAKLYVATLVPEIGIPTSASGYATVLLAGDERSARVTVQFSGLSTGQTAAHIHGPALPGQNAGIVFGLPLGVFNDVLWVIEPSARLTVQEQVDALKAGRLYINVHSMTAPDGEIRGHLRPAPGAGAPPAQHPFVPSVPTRELSISRFLDQATFGGTPALQTRVRSIGMQAFLNEQFAAAPSLYAPFVLAASDAIDTSRTSAFRSRFFYNGLRANDQLRQRVAFALSQILVVSGRDIPDGPGLATYHDILVRNAFGNYRQLLEEVTLNGVMGNYLDMVNNDKPNPATGRTANENYAREILQLFSIGVFELHPNGTLRLDPTGLPIPTYGQDTVEGLARVFTGWTYGVKPGATPGARNPTNYMAPMSLWPPNHDVGMKRILGGRVLPAGQTGTQDLKDALDTIFDHPNVGPFLGRRLIQHLVTSNPTPGYTARVTAAFNNNGAGVRGDLRAVVRAVLLDPEAVGKWKSDPGYGHLQEPATFVVRFLRGVGALGDGYGLYERVSQMEQNVFYPPTVFSFYQPDHLVPGSVLLGPEFQIYTESTSIRRANFVNSILNAPITPPSYAPLGAIPMSIDINPWRTLAADPVKLVDAVNARLMHGAMPPDMRAEVLQAATAIPATRPESRARTAIYLVATSPQFGVVR